VKTYSLHVPATLDISPELRRIALHIFSECGFRGNTVEHLKLIFDEVLMNAVKYGSLPNSTIYITFEFVENKLTVYFEDEGGENKISAEELRRIIAYQQENNDPGKTSGRGLAQIASKLSDELQICNGKKGGLCIAFKKKLRTPEETLKKEAVVAGSQNVNTPEATFSEQKIFALSGELDNVHLAEKSKPVDDFLQRIVSPTLVILDFSAVTFCTSVAIAKLASWKHDLLAKKSDLLIKNTSTNILEILDLVGLNKFIRILSTEDSQNIKNS